MEDLQDVKTNEELVAETLGARPEAFRELYDRFYSRTYRVAYGMTGRHELAEDLTQEIFIRAFQKLAKYDRRSSFATWFYRLSINHSLNYRKREMKESHKAEVDAQFPASVAEQRIELTILGQQVQTQINRALISLKPKHRMVVILKDVEGLNIAEIAERMNCSAGTVASRLFRARDLLARKLDHLRDTF
ncbi:MAG TPA: RNA polymerase sigma factor [Pyrinomonadaceae bacterium]|nr:RNA polymerase sigma factor [Pyrinomonadaceae bacterium]